MSSVKKTVATCLLAAASGLGSVSAWARELAPHEGAWTDWLPGMVASLSGGLGTLEIWFWQLMRF